MENQGAIEHTSRRLSQSLLMACGELGYRNVRVGDIFEEDDLAQFETLFENKAECFVDGYVRGMGAVAMLLPDGHGDDRCLGQALESGLSTLAHLLDRNQPMARSLAVEIRAVGGRAREVRRRTLHSLARRLDGVLRAPDVTPKAPTRSALFMVSVIETMAADACLADDTPRFARATPELAAMIVGAYARAPASPPILPLLT